MLFLTTNATGPGWCTALPCWEWDGTSLQQIQPASGSAFTVVHQTRHKPTNRQKRHGTSTRLSEGEVTYCTQRKKERERERHGYNSSTTERLYQIEPRERHGYNSSIMERIYQIEPRERHGYNSSITERIYQIEDAFNRQRLPK